MLTRGASPGGRKHVGSPGGLAPRPGVAHRGGRLAPPRPRRPPMARSINHTPRMHGRNGYPSRGGGTRGAPTEAVVRELPLAW
jgi:hypothetical protein